MYETTYVQAKANGFANCSKELVEKLSYLREVSNVTGADISALPLAQVDTIEISDKRALNKLIFTLNTSSVPVDRLSKFREISEQLKEVDIIYATQMRASTKQSRDYALTQANEYARIMSSKLVQATEFNDNLRELMQVEYSSGPEIERVLASGFWSFHKWYQVDAMIELVTSNEVILKSSGPYAKEALPMGYYKVLIRLKTGSITLAPLKNNRFYSAYFHPYCSSSGGMCFGASQETANKYRTTRQYDKYFSLLASLLSYYDPNSNPYIHIDDFKKAPQQGVQEANVSRVESDESEPTCEHCDRTQIDCDCHYCDACDETYLDGSTCRGNYCESCEECCGSEHCDTHYCGICAENSIDRSGNCTNNCCTVCDSRDSRCNRCRSCCEHDGEHDEGCENAPEPEPTPEPTF